MYHTEQLPLSIYFLLPTQTKSIQPFVCSDVAKYRLHHGHAMTVYLFALVAVDSVLHPVSVIRFSFVLQQEGDLPTCAFGFLV